MVTHTFFPTRGHQSRLSLQTAYKLALAEEAHGKRIDEEVKPAARMERLRAVTATKRVMTGLGRPSQETRKPGNRETGKPGNMHTSL